MSNQDHLMNDEELPNYIVRNYSVSSGEANHLAQFIATQKRLYAESQFKTEFRELLEKLDAYNFAHTLAIVIFMKTMEKTNATDATFTLEGFNQNGVVLGDMVITASLRAESED